MNKIKKFSIFFLIFFLIFDFYFFLKLESYGDLYTTLIKPFNFFITKNIEKGIYPFFFNSFNGMDIIGESQSGPLYPINFILYFFNIDIDMKYNILFCSYLIIGLFGIFFFINKKINLSLILLLIFFLLIPFFRVNFVHQFFIGSVIHFLIIIFFYILKIENKISDKYFTFFSSIFISLLIFVGNYTLQWLFLTALIISLFFLCKKFKKNFFLFFLPIVFGSFISFLQIFLTFDLIQISDRSSEFFDYSKFNNFLSGIILSNFFNPLSPYSTREFFHNGITPGVNSDNLIFIGLLPLICIFSDVKYNNILKSPVRFFLFIIFSIAFFRALGGLFLPNFILKSLPVFGQFRAVFRDLITIQVLFLAYFFYLIRVNKITLDKKITAGLLILSFLIFIINEITRFILIKEFSYLNLIYIIFPICYAIVVFYKIKNKFQILLITCIFELSFCNLFYPGLLGKKISFDEIKNCNLPLNFYPVYTEFQYKYDHTLFKNIFKYHPYDNKNISIYKDNIINACPSISYIDQSTLTSINTKLFFENNKVSDEFINLYLSLLFPNITQKNLIELNSYIKNNEHLFVKTKFNSMNMKINLFNLIKKFRIENYFKVEKNYKPRQVLLNNKIMNILPYGDKRILIINNKNEIIKPIIVGPFNLIKEKHKMVNIYYIPLFEFLGLFISFFSIISLALYTKYKK
jgi:hypothetical protein